MYIGILENFQLLLWVKNQNVSETRSASFTRYDKQGVALAHVLKEPGPRLSERNPNCRTNCGFLKMA
jgi:hypothetical protein